MRKASIVLSAVLVSLSVAGNAMDVLFPGEGSLIAGDELYVEVGDVAQDGRWIDVSLGDEVLYRHRVDWAFETQAFSVGLDDVSPGSYLATIALLNVQEEELAREEIGIEILGGGQPPPGLEWTEDPPGASGVPEVSIEYVSDEPQVGKT